MGPEIYNSKCKLAPRSHLDFGTNGKLVNINVLNIFHSFYENYGLIQLSPSNTLDNLKQSI